jgi:rRNA maturation protein Nop10
MKSQEVQLSPCPECGGTRAVFEYRTQGNRYIYLHVGFDKNVRLYAYTCLTCGGTTLHPAPDYMEQFRLWAERRRPFKLRL